MDSLCEYCKANLQGIEYKSKIRPKGNFNDLLKQHGGSIKAVRQFLTHNNDSGCTCDELNLKLRCSLSQNRKYPTFELSSTIHRILTACKYHDCYKETIITLIQNTQSPSDIYHCRDKLWKLCNIDLSHCQMNDLPMSFGEILVGVKRCNLGFNCFKEVPISLAKCSQLEYLNMSNNFLRYIPSWLSNHKLLKYFEVKSNYIMSLVLQGKDDRSKLVNENCEEASNPNNWIETVDYERNRIIYFNKKNGELNVRSRNKDPQYQHKSPNRQSTQKVKDNETVMSHLHELFLCNNRLVSLPKIISRMTFLTVLKINENQITSLPELGNLVNLRVFDASKNKIKDIPSSLQNCNLLEEINLSSNNINRFPDCILEIKNLRSLNTSCNSIKYVPYRLGFLENLTMLDMSRNPLIDPPYEIFTQVTRKILWECRQLFWTQHHATLPMIQVHDSGIGGERIALDPDFESEVFEKLEIAAKSSALHLENLNLSYIPNKIYDYANITKISFQGNPLLNFDWKCSSISLISLNLRDCRLEHINSNSIKSLPNLEYLDLEGNVLTSLPSTISKLDKLKVLILNKNHLGALPQDIGDMSNLVELHLNHNFLREIPECISLLKSLKVFCASHNKLKKVPQSIIEMKKMKVLNLRQNKLKQVPALGDLHLTKLCLSQNEIDMLDPDFFLPNLKTSM